ncbi:MAG: glycosyltransferase family 61 protein, partial [Methyloprofundus sp.]|nr:glycosyltransferase family 61 protein [Methyloprofundus sp.]
MINKLKYLMSKALSPFLNLKINKERAKGVWAFELSESKKKYEKNDFALSKGEVNDQFLRNGKIVPEGIPLYCRVASQAPLVSREYLYEITDVTLKGRYPVIYKEHRPLFDSVFFSLAHDRFGSQLKSNLIGDVKNQFLGKKNGKKPRYVGKCCLLFSKWNHYGHWVPEHLLKLKTLVDALGDEAYEISLVLEKKPPDWKLKILRSLGWDDSKIIEWDAEQCLVDRLLCPSYPVPNYEGYRWLKKSVFDGLGLHPNRKKNRRLYLSRNKFGSRMVSNEIELTSCLRGYGFEVLYPETMSVENQLLAFSEAEIILGPHGSAFTNIIFAENANIIEFFGKFVPLGFFCYSKVMGHNYNPLFCESGPKK